MKMRLFLVMLLFVATTKCSFHDIFESRKKLCILIHDDLCGEKVH
jgi:hypothetical protein